MDLIELVFKNLAYVFFLVGLYYFYVIYKRTYNEKENGLVFTLIIYSILYLEFKYGMPFFSSMPIILINVPLVIAMLKNKRNDILIVSLCLIIYYYSYFNNFLILIVLEYLSYYLIYKKYDNIYNSLFFIFLLKTGMMSIYFLYSGFDYVYIFMLLIEMVIFYLISVIIIYAFQKSEDLFKMFLLVKDLNQNSQIKNSLFKISHEIKNPIAVCKGYLDMFDINNKEHCKKYIPIIKEEIDRTLFLLEDFLAMNKLKIKKEILDINMLLEEIINNYKPIFKKNKINLISEIPNDEIYINGDYNRLMQVIINILKNSIEAKDTSKDMNMHIYLKKNNKNIIINFWDNGIGISKENLKKIKDPFFTTKIGGTGLGTSLSSEIIEAHNGNISFESVEGQYTLVKIKLPLEEI